MKIEYIKVGDYYFPNLKTEKSAPVGKFGRLRQMFLKEHEYPLYFKLLVNGELNKHLAMIEQEANDMKDELIDQYKEKRNITEKLKASNQMLWVQEMNNIQNCVNEIILKDIIYK